MTKPANGKCPPSALVLVQTGTYKGLPYLIYLETATAAAFEEAQTAGGLSISPPLGGNRSILDQEHLKDEPGQYGSSLPQSKIGVPGTSTHGYGDCVDIQAGNAWFQIHCSEYGFVRESPAGENNHYRYLHPTWANAPATSLAGVGTSAPVTPPIRIGDRMPIVLRVTGATVDPNLAGFNCLMGFEGVTHFGSEADANRVAIQTNWDQNPAAVSETDFNLFRAAFQIPDSVVLKPGVRWVREGNAAAVSGAVDLSPVLAAVAATLAAVKAIPAAPTEFHAG